MVNNLNKHFDRIDDGRYIIIALNWGGAQLVHTGRGFCREKKRAKIYSFQEVQVALKKIRSKGVTVTFEFVN